MLEKEKQLLLQDLCARLPYGVKIKFDDGTSDIYNLDGNIQGKFTENLANGIEDCGLKPYLRPMSSMTEEECVNLSRLMPYDEVETWKYIKTPVPLVIANPMQFDFFHLHHLDWRGLIEKGLAIEVTEENNPYKN